MRTFDSYCNAVLEGGLFNLVALLAHSLFLSTWKPRKELL
jgi:hypothetical protein